MAKAKVMLDDYFTLRLAKAGTELQRIAKKAVYEGAKVIADEVKQNLLALPEENYKQLKKDEQFSGVPTRQKEDLIQSFGVTKSSIDRDGTVNVKIGFDGYGKYKTKKYPKGVPNQLLARSIESGSSVRKKTPFFRKAVSSKKKEAIAIMQIIVGEELAKITKG